MICHLLKREIGANPMLSRNCKWGVYTRCHCSHAMGRRIDDEPKPGYLPICNLCLNHEDGASE